MKTSDKELQKLALRLVDVMARKLKPERKEALGEALAVLAEVTAHFLTFVEDTDARAHAYLEFGIQMKNKIDRILKEDEKNDQHTSH